MNAQWDILVMECKNLVPTRRDDPNYILAAPGAILPDWTTNIYKNNRYSKINERVLFK